MNKLTPRSAAKKIAPKPANAHAKKEVKVKVKHPEQTPQELEVKLQFDEAIAPAQALPHQKNEPQNLKPAPVKVSSVITKNHPVRETNTADALAAPGLTDSTIVVVNPI